jgi:hypothetical protein
MALRSALRHHRVVVGERRVGFTLRQHAEPNEPAEALLVS